MKIDMKSHFNLWHMLGSFVGGVVLTSVVIISTSGAGLQGNLRGVALTVPLNPAAGSCKVTNCDVNAKLDQILAQLKGNNNGSLANYIAEQFTNTNNALMYINGQLSVANNALSNAGIGSAVEWLAGYIPQQFTEMNNQFAAVNNKLFEIKTDTGFLAGYLPGQFTDLKNMLQELLNK